MWLIRIQDLKPDLEIWTLDLFVSCVAKSMNSCWMRNFVALHIYMTAVCLHMVLAYVEAVNKEKAKIHMECYPQVTMYAFVVSFAIA